MLNRVRKLFPPNGPQYELFNLSLWFAGVFVLNYLAAPPSPTSRRALAWLLGETPLMLWAIGVTVALVFALVAAYVPRLLAYGYGAVGGAAIFWGGVLAVGAFEDPSPNVVGAIILYGGWARHAVYLARRA